MANYFLSASGPNVVQINDSFANYALLQKATVTTVAIGTSGGAGGTLTVTGQNPVIAFGGVNNAVMIGRTQSGSNFTFDIRTAGAATLTVYVFDLPSYSAAKYLEIRNASNQVIFDGGKKYMRVAYMFAANLSVLDELTQTLPGGRTYAALASMNGCRVIVGGGFAGPDDWATVTETYRAVINISSNVATCKMARFTSVSRVGHSGDPYPPVGNYGTGQTLCPVLDVTGY